MHNSKSSLDIDGRLMAAASDRIQDTHTVASREIIQYKVRHCIVMYVVFYTKYSPYFSCTLADVLYRTSYFQNRMPNRRFLNLLVSMKVSLSVQGSDLVTFQSMANLLYNLSM